MTQKPESLQIFILHFIFFDRKLPFQALFPCSLGYHKCAAKCFYLHEVAQYHGGSHVLAGEGYV